MKLLKIRIGNEAIGIYLKQTKVISSNKPEMLYRYLEYLYKSVRSFRESEYDEDNTISYEITLNDNPITNKNTEVFRFDPWWNLEDEIKMLSGSLSKAYLSLLIKDMVQDLNLQRINEHLEIYFDDIIQDESTENFHASIIMNTLNATTLPKLLSYQLVSDSIEYKNHNTNYIDRLKIFVHLIDQVCLRDKLKHYIIIVDVPVWNQNIKKIIKEINHDNLTVLVICTQLDTLVDFDDLYLIGNQTIDLLNEESRLQLIEYYGIGVDFETNSIEISDILKNQEKFQEFIRIIL